MKKTTLAVIITTIALTACTEPKKQEVKQRVVEQTNPETGITDLSPRLVTDTCTVKGKQYTYSYDFHAVDSLPIVCNAQGVEYHDNTATLTIRERDNVIFHKVFDKHSLGSIVPEQHLETTALVGISFDYTKQNDQSAFHFILTVGDPDESNELYFPASVTIKTDGTVTYERATNIETAPLRPGLNIDPEI